MSENLRPDDFFTLTTPRTRRTDDLTIPCFSLVQICAMEEYVRRSGDVGFFAEYEENYRAVTENFLSRREKNGLLKAVKGKYYWNFYEWSEGLEGNFFEEPEDRYELPLNAFFVVALRAFAVLEENAGKDGKEYRKAAEDSSRALEAFFDEERGCYADFMDKGGNLRGYSELSNALAALVSAQEEHRKKALESLAERGTLTHVTLSCSLYKYLALIGAGKAEYRRYVEEDISRIWGDMLARGAKTFFEDERGEAAFGGAGSLSHGWSAVPVYIYHLLYGREDIPAIYGGRDEGAEKAADGIRRGGGGKPARPPARSV